MNVHNLSEINEIANEMIAHMKEQIENPALLNSRFVFDEVLFTNIDFQFSSVQFYFTYVVVIQKHNYKNINRKYRFAH